MSASEAEKKVEEEREEVKGGELLFCGATCWDIIGRRKGIVDGNLVSPSRLRPLVGVDIRFVASGCVSCHCVALDVEGRCYTWGRNEKGQLGHGDMIQRDRPTVVSELSKYKILKAGAGRSHTVVVTEDGNSLAFGWNKHGQLGSGSVRNEIESSPVRCLVSEVKHTACGGDFTVWLSSVEGASILTAGLPQYGQLGHGTDNEYNSKDSSVRLVYEPQPRPRAIAALAGETVVKVACGTNHTVAVDKNGYVYTWGFGGYGRLGHREQKDEWVPRRVEVFQNRNLLPPDAIVSAGSVSSSCTAGGGQLYMWGKLKNTGDDWMYPKPLMDLSGWNIRCMDSGNMHHFVGADSSCISWGHAQNGELGYGPSGQKSSAVPKKVDILEGMHVISVACGMGHSMVIVDRANVADRLDQLDIYDGKAVGEGNEVVNTTAAPKQAAKKGAKAAENSKKRKKSKDSSESEDEEEEDAAEESDDSEDDEINGEADVKRSRSSGKGRGKASKTSSAKGKGSAAKGKGGGRGRGGTSANKSSSKSPQVKSGKRGRPRKS
ncbi:protein RCC2 [Vigna radiata var. radiata]|uniref:Protein RCC2 n=1 Tax=Vigna radiata var. radiata TaxID=3916 RepID=A0A1S3U826_VIGRR|nr:protein RCC2 [Vigna radiata var. radiata]